MVDGSLYSKEADFVHMTYYIKLGLTEWIKYTAIYKNQVN